MKWDAHFYGRTKGAIGIFYWIDTQVEAPDVEAAHLKLYETHEHIHLTGLRITPATDETGATDGR